MNYADLAEEHKTVKKQLDDAHKQLVANMRMIQSLNHDKEWKQKELNKLKTAVLAEVVDPTVDGRTLMEQLYAAPRSIARYALGKAKVVLAHVLALVKPCHPSMDMRLHVDGAAAECMKEQFNEYHP